MGPSITRGSLVFGSGFGCQPESIPLIPDETSLVRIMDYPRRRVNCDTTPVWQDVEYQQLKEEIHSWFRPLPDLPGGMADLEGTPKQVSWATSIRSKFIARAVLDGLDDLVEVLREISDATWFIAAERRGWTAAEMRGRRRPRPDQIRDASPEGGAR